MDSQGGFRLSTASITLAALVVLSGLHTFQISKNRSILDLLSYEVAVGRVISQRETRGVGSVSLTLVETAFDNRVWVGFIRADVDMSLSEAQRRERIGNEMHNMLRDFPPGQPR